MRGRVRPRERSRRVCRRMSRPAIRGRRQNASALPRNARWVDPAEAKSTHPGARSYFAGAESGARPSEPLVVCASRLVTLVKSGELVPMPVLALSAALVANSELVLLMEPVVEVSVALVKAEGPDIARPR